MGRSTQTATTAATRMVHAWLATDKLRCNTTEAFTRTGRLVVEAVTCRECKATFKL